MLFILKKYQEEIDTLVTPVNEFLLNILTKRAYSQPEAALSTCGRRPQDFLSHMSRNNSGCMVSLAISYHEDLFWEMKW